MAGPAQVVGRLRKRRRDYRVLCLRCGFSTEYGTLSWARRLAEIHNGKDCQAKHKPALSGVLLVDRSAPGECIRCGWPVPLNEDLCDLCAGIL